MPISALGITSASARRRTLAGSRVENLEGAACPFNGEVGDSGGYSTIEL